MVKPVVVLAVAEGKERLTQELGSNLCGRTCKVLPLTVPASRISSNPFTNLFTVYNRTELQHGVGFLVQQCGNLSKEGNPSPVVLCATGCADLWALLAAPAADAVVADCDQLNVTSDEALLMPDLLCPGIRNIGTFEGAAMLAAAHPLLLHNTGDKFPTEALHATDRALGAGKKLRIESRKLNDDEIVEWISKVK